LLISGTSSVFFDAASLVTNGFRILKSQKLQMEAEVEYEALPDHAGLGVHMLAGALVRRNHRHGGRNTDPSPYNSG
jgi:hypothetical protein